MVRVLADDEVGSLIDLAALLDVVEEAFLAQGAGAVERPDRPHYPMGRGLDPEDPDAPLGTGLVMPAYLHGAAYAATKLVGVHEGNADRGLPTVHAQVAVTAADTGRPAAYMDATTLTNARTGCIGGVAARALVDGPVTLGVLGAGTQARWQTRAIDAAVGVERVRVFSPSDSRVACAEELRREHGLDAAAVAAPDQAVDGADVVVTATTSTEPVFDGHDLAPAAVVIAIGAYTEAFQELDCTTMGRAGRIYADVPEEVATIGDVVNTGVDPDELVPLAALLAGDDDPPTEEVVVVDSVGSAVLDAAAAEYVLDRALAGDVGTEVAL